MTTAQDQQSRAADLRATIDMLDECAKAGKPWPYVPSTASIRAALDELEAAQVLAMLAKEQESRKEAQQQLENCKAELAKLEAYRFAMNRGKLLPQGWKAVPAEHTEEMKRAAMELLLDGLDIYVNGQDQIVIETDAPRRLWKAFLSAAPRPPAAQESEQLDRIAVLTKIDAVLCKEKNPLQAADEICAMAAQERQPLTDEQIEAIPVWVNFVGLWPQSRKEIVRAIESAHGISHPTGD